MIERFGIYEEQPILSLRYFDGKKHIPRDPMLEIPKFVPKVIRTQEEEEREERER